MNRISVSFVIPYYKVPLALLLRCIDSVRAIGKHADWEIRLIDDGTPGDEARRYVDGLKDNRIHYHAQTNLGLSMARNNGLAFCQKEYIHFLDADDYLFLTPTLQALALLDKERPDLLAFNFRKVYNEHTSDMPASPVRIRFRGSGTAYMLQNNLHGAAWGYFFRRKATGNVRFTPGIYHEDEEFTPLLWMRMGDVIVTTLPVYAYYQRNDSILHNPDRKKVSKRYDDMLNVLVRLRREAARLPEPASRALRKRTDMVALAMLYTLMHESPDRDFLTHTLESMRKEGFYPLPSAHWSPLYRLFRVFTLRPAFVRLLWKRVFRRSV